MALARSPCLCLFAHTAVPCTAGACRAACIRTTFAGGQPALLLTSELFLLCPLRSPPRFFLPFPLRKSDALAGFISANNTSLPMPAHQLSLRSRHVRHLTFGM